MSPRAAQPVPLRDLVGRAPEIETLVHWFREGRTVCLVLEGEAGIGKSTVWAAAVRSIRDSAGRVLMSAPAEAESRLSYSGLADLLAADLPTLRASLPGPQATALSVALRMEEPGDRPPDETAVARGLLAALRRLARARGQLLVAVDDVRWLDAPSLAAVAYAARRLEPDDGVRLLTTQRIGAPEPSFLHGLNPERVRLGPVSIGGIHRIIRLQTGQALARPRLLELYAASSGNPLHALELARASGVDGHVDAGSVGSLFLVRHAALPRPTRQAFLLIAASADRSVARLERAWGPDFRAAIEPAQAAGFVSLAGQQARPVHPLFTRLAYEEADEAALREVHRSLAATATTSEERATHLGRSVVGSDVDAAAEIEAAAFDARARGVRALSATLFETAARITPNAATVDRARRMLAAASAWFEAGDLVLARGRLDALIADLPPGSLRSEAQMQLGIVLHEAGRWPDALAAFADALAETDEPRLVAETHRRMALTSGHIGSVAEGTAHAETALEAAEASGDPETITYCLATLGLAHVMAGAPLEVFGSYLERALRLEQELDHVLTGWTPRLVVAEFARLSLDLERARQLYASVLAEAEASGDATLEHWAAYGLGSTEMLAGDYLKAGQLADRALELAETTGVLDLYGRRLKAQVDAHLGLAPRAREQALAALASAEASGGKLHAMAAHTALGQLALASGEPVVASGDLRAAREIAVEMGFWNGVTIRAMLDESEAAAAAAGSLDQAREVLDLVTARAGAEPPVWLGPLVARGEGLLLAASGDLEAAERLLEHSADGLRLGFAPLETGRALLVLGAVQRRARRYASARASLADAAAIFEHLGAALWAQRVRDELSRIPGRRGGDTQALTASEERIAGLVARGRTNREVASELFVSVKTVELTLTHVYQKLRVRSRAELAARFSGPVASTSKD